MIDHEHGYLALTYFAGEWMMGPDLGPYLLDSVLGATWGTIHPPVASWEA